MNQSGLLLAVFPSESQVSTGTYKAESCTRWVTWRTALTSQRQKNQKFKPILGYIVTKQQSSQKCLCDVRHRWTTEAPYDCCWPCHREGCQTCNSPAIDTHVEPHSFPRNLESNSWVTAVNLHLCASWIQQGCQGQKLVYCHMMLIYHCCSSGHCLLLDSDF